MRKIGMGHSIVLLTIVITFCTCEAGASEWEIKKIGDDAVPETARWCGETHKIVWQAATSGIHVSDPSFVKAHQLTDSWKHTKPFCSPDGRYVFFLDEEDARITLGEVSIPVKSYEFFTRQTQVIKGLDKDLVYSPDMKFAVTTKGEERDVILPSGERMPVFKISPILPGYSQPGVRAALPNKKIVIAFTKTPFHGVPIDMAHGIFDIRTGTLIIQTQLQHQHEAKISPDGTRLYVTMFANYELSEKVSVRPSFDLIRMNIGASLSGPVLVRKGIQGFDVFGEHIVFLVRESSTSKILLSDTEGQHAELIASFPWIVEQISFSSDGDHLLFTREMPQKVSYDGPDGPPVSRSVYVLSKISK